MSQSQATVKLNITRSTLGKILQLLAVQTLRKGLLYRNADQWSLLCKFHDAVEQATKHEVQQSKIEQFFCAAEAEEQQ